MFKWVEIALQNNRVRHEALSLFLRDSGFENSVDFIETGEEDFKKNLPAWLAQFDSIRVGHGLGEVVVPLFNRHGMVVERIRAADSIMKIDGEWWLRAYAVDGFSRILSRVGKKFDLDSRVLLVGTGAAARVAMTALFRVGFRQFTVSNLEEKKATAFIGDMKKFLLGAVITFVPREGLILLPGQHGVLVNTTQLAKDNPLLEDLYYFNFFKTGGLAIDFSISPVETPLLIGARDVGASCVHGYQISACTDIIWAEEVMGRALRNAEKYEQALGEALRIADAPAESSTSSM